MKLNEIFDPNFYDHLQDKMQRSKHDPFEDDPITDTKMDMNDFIVSKFEAGKISFRKARKELKKASTTKMEFEFWMMELISARELLD